jgi:hypothetical protein
VSDPISRRSFSTLTAGVVLGSMTNLAAADDKQKNNVPQASVVPTEAAFARDYSPPKFTPSWKKPQINRLLVQDFVIEAEPVLSYLQSVKRLELKPNPFLKKSESAAKRST